MKKNIDTLKIHTLTTQVDHPAFMAYRAAIKTANMSSAAFLRCLVTIGLNEVAPIVSKSQQKMQLQKQMNALQAKMNALNGSAVSINLGPVSKSTKPAVTPSGRVRKGLVATFIAINPHAKVHDVQAYMSSLKGEPVTLSSASNAYYRNRFVHTS